MKRGASNVVSLLAMSVIIMSLIAGCLSSCVPLKERNKRKAAIIFAETPEVIANLAALAFPCDTTDIISDTTVVYDTLWGAPDVQIFTDTIRVNDTITIVKTVQPPPRTIVKTVTIRDTIKVKDNAALKACEIVRDNAISNETEVRKELLIAKSKLKTRSAIMWSLVLLIVGAIGYKLYAKYKTKILKL